MKTQSTKIPMRRRIETKLTGVLALVLSAGLTSLFAQEETEPSKQERRVAGAQPGHKVQAKDGPVVQLALLLDTSSSMSGLIDQAKTQLWQVVNEFVAAKQEGKAPVVQVALIEYGNNGLSPDDRWVQTVQPLTRDLDALSQSLFSLRAATRSGSSEYCGTAIMKAAKSLDWHSSSQIYKAVFIAGNESFAQGDISPNRACLAAIQRGVIVNTVFCGAEAEGIRLGWKEGALRSDGEYLHIDHNQAVAQIAAPQDEAIVSLNRALNDTYVAFGLEADANKANQLAQDANAGGVAVSNLAARARTKASANYFNASWDIVDASLQEDFHWDGLDEESLPAELRELSTEELKAYVSRKREERERLQQEILDLTRTRENFVADKRRELGEDRTLGSAVAEVVRRQASTKGVRFESAKSRGPEASPSDAP